MISGNLPISQNSEDTKQFFDKFFVNQVSFPAAEIDAVISFFLKRDFDLESSRSITIILLNQAKIDNVNVFQLLDTLKKLTDVQLNQVIAQILNSYRENISLLGYRIAEVSDVYESRNILV